jgi:hypothetical protein
MNKFINKSMNRFILAMTLCLTAAVAASGSSAQRLLPPGWDPVQAGDEVMAGLVKVTAPEAKGAHDSEMVLVGNQAYIVAMLNDERRGETSRYPFIYCALSIVNLDTLEVEAVIPFARSEQAFDNETLPFGACFVPRILQIDATTLRCYFSSRGGESQVWFRDFDLKTREFAPTIHRAQIKTAAGVFDMQPQYFHADAAALGFSKSLRRTLYIIDSFKVFDGRIYTVVNNYGGHQNSLAVLNDDRDTFEIIGHFNDPEELDFSEASINRLPDGTWMAILRSQAGDRNYAFSESKDGREWTTAEYRDLIPNGWSSKPTFNRFGDIYYLGWQETTRIDDVGRSVFNVEVSRDGRTWERKYRFETRETFQYPTFHEHEGVIWLCVTQGAKERIMFGKLEDSPVRVAE